MVDTVSLVAPFESAGLANLDVRVLGAGDYDETSMVVASSTAGQLCDGTIDSEGGDIYCGHSGSAILLKV